MDADDSLSFLYRQVETIAYPELPALTGDTAIPWWIIIVSVVGGLLLLALFTFCLWKLGFFKRRRPDPTLSGNLEKSKHGENKKLLHGGGGNGSGNGNGRS